MDAGDVLFRLGTAGVVDPERWNVLRVRARNTGGDFRGTLEVRGMVGDHAEGIVYRLPVEVPGKGAAREISIALRPRGWTGFRATLDSPGWRKTWEEELILPGEEPPGRILICEARGTDWTRLLSAPQLSSFAVARISPADLPSESLAHDLFSVILLNGATLAESPPGAAAALGRWVERGGILLAFPGPEWAGGIPGATLDLLGVSAGDPARRPGPLARRVGSGTYRALDPLPGTETVLDGVAFLSRRGCGVVECFSFGPGGAFPDRSDGENLHRALGPALERLGALNGRAARVLEELESPLLQSFFTLAGMSFPSWVVVAAAMSGYVLLGIVIPWGVFTRLRRREWAYPVMLAASALSMVGIARYGLLGAAQSAECVEMSVARAHASGTRAEVTTYAGLISPRRREAAFEAGSSAAGIEVLAQPLQSEALMGEVAPFIETAIDARQGGSVLEPLAFYPNALRAFRFEHEADLEDVLRVQRIPGKYSVQLWNRTDERMALYIFRNNGCFEIVDVGPGKDRVVDLSDHESTLRQFESQPGTPLARGSDPAEVFLQTLVGSLEAELEGKPFTEPILIARSSRPLLPLRAPGFRRRAHTFIIVEP